MIKEYEVLRNGETLSFVDAKSENEAIDKAISDHLMEKFGQGGALTEQDIIEEEDFLNGHFEAIPNN